MPPQHMILKAKRFDLHAGIRMWGGYPAVARMLERQRPTRVPVSLHTDLSCYGLRQESIQSHGMQGRARHAPLHCKCVTAEGLLSQSLGWPCLHEGQLQRSCAVCVHAVQQVEVCQFSGRSAARLSEACWVLQSLLLACPSKVLMAALPADLSGAGCQHSRHH